MNAELQKILKGDMAERFLTVIEVGELLSVSARTVWRLRDSGQLPQPVHVSRHLLRWRLSDIVAYMRSGTAGRATTSAVTTHEGH